MIGKTLGHYQITEKLGEGGMGVVYKARDTHLDRTVAIKVLPPEKVSDPERKRRFVQEAKSASALNHPNIVHVYDIDQSDGTDYIAMEYVDGKTLDQLIPRKGMRLSEALKCAVQIADALAAAHAAGIIHRDLKPANLMVTDKGLVKVLDFGLAKLTEPVETDAFGTTETMEPHTEDGTIVGTVAYMSPEQAEGKKVDARSDIFSLGSVLYEMVTGQKAFQGTSKMSTLSAILHQEPKPVSTIAQAIPDEFEKLINRCLRKDAERRIQHMDDVKLTLLELKEDSDSGRLQTAPAAAKQVTSMRLVIGAVVVVALVAAGWYWFSSPRHTELEAPLVPVHFTTYPGLEWNPSFSPDGNQVAFQWKGEKQDNYDIYIKQIGSESLRRLTADPRDDGDLAWSPDGQSIAFVRYFEAGKTVVMLVPANGGRERQVAELRTLKGQEGRWSCWHPGGKWLAVVCDQDSAVAPSAIYLLSSETGERRRLTSPPKGAKGDTNPAFSPDGRSLAFVRVFFGSTSELYLLRVSAGLLPEGELKQLTFMNQDTGYPAWMPDGKEIVFASGSASHHCGLWRIPVSGASQPRPLPFSGEGNGLDPAISLEKHRLIYAVWSMDANIWRCQIPNGMEKPEPPKKLMASTLFQGQAQYSPDGKAIAYLAWASGSAEIWVCDRDGSNPLQLTHLGGPVPESLRWSPDGQKIIFDSASKGELDLYLIPAQGGGMRQLTHTPFNEQHPSFSRDGKWIYFSSDRSGDFQVWKMPTEGGEAVQITRKGGFRPQESADGNVLFYLKPKEPGCNELWKVPVAGGEESRVLEGIWRTNFDVKEHRIYYASCPDPEKTTLLLLSYDFASAKTKHIITIQNGLGFNVTPDEQEILYLQGGGQRSDLMLVENFRPPDIPKRKAVRFFLKSRAPQLQTGGVAWSLESSFPSC